MEQIATGLLKYDLNEQVILILYQLKIKSFAALCRRLTSGRPISAAGSLGNAVPKLQWLQAVGDNMTDLTGPEIELQTSCTDIDVFNVYYTCLLKLV